MIHSETVVFCKKSEYIYGLLYKSYYNTMVQSIEFTKIWTNIYRQDTPTKNTFFKNKVHIQGSFHMHKKNSLNVEVS